MKCLNGHYLRSNGNRGQAFGFLEKKGVISPRMNAPSLYRILPVVLIINLLNFPVFSQTQGVQFSFDRQNNFTYSTRLQSVFSYQSKRYRLETILLHENLLNNSRPPARFVNFQVQADIWQYWNIRPGLSAAAWTDAQLFFNSDAHRVTQYLGAEYQPNASLRVRPMVGWSWDYLNGRLDQGFSPALFVQTRQDLGGGLQMETQAYLRAKYIAPRHQRNAMLLSRWSQQFGRQAGISFFVQGGANQMDAYKLGSVEAIKSDTAGGGISLEYQLLPGLVWESQNSVVWSQRRFDYATLEAPQPEFNDLQFRQLEWNTRQKLSLAGSKGFLTNWQAAFTYEYQNLDRRYDLDNDQDLPTRDFERLVARERQKDYLRNLTNLELAIRGRILARHTLDLTANNRYLQYDTPEPGNDDDHDQLNYGVSAAWQSNWSRHFFTQYRLIGSVRQYAFLYAARSSENYTQRNLRMDFRFRWDLLPRLQLEGEQFIYVTYNVKDFTDINLTDRSTRNLESNFKIRYRESRKLNHVFSFYRREQQVSYLNWRQFAETTLDTTLFYIMEETSTLELRSPWKNTLLLLDLGYRHFTQLRYQNTSMISLDSILTPINLHNRNHQTGPQTGIRIRNSRQASIDFSVWWQIQVQNNKFSPLDFFPSTLGGFREENLRKTDVFFRPFLKLQLNWLLSSPATP